MNTNKKKTEHLLLAVLLQFCIMAALVKFQQSVFMSLPLAVRAVLSVVLQWLLLFVPIAFMKRDKISLTDIGISKIHLAAQIFAGFILGISMSLIFTVLPILAGYKTMVGSTSYTHAWQFCYQFIYMIFGVAMAEEVFYRGFLFKRLMDVSHSKYCAVLVSSVVFGLSHLFSGSMLQAVTTSVLGIFFCVCRDKIKPCTTISLILAHGIHNALITLFVAILP